MRCFTRFANLYLKNQAPHTAPGTAPGTAPATPPTYDIGDINDILAAGSQRNGLIIFNPVMNSLSSRSYPHTHSKFQRLYDTKYLNDFIEDDRI